MKKGGSRNRSKSGSKSRNRSRSRSRDRNISRNGSSSESRSSTSSKVNFSLSDQFDIPQEIREKIEIKKEMYCGSDNPEIKKKCKRIQKREAFIDKVCRMSNSNGESYYNYDQAKCNNVKKYIEFDCENTSSHQKVLKNNIGINHNENCIFN